MSAQKSCFTIQGKCAQGLDKLVDNRILRKYTIESNAVEEMQSDLRMMGVTNSTVFPDLDGLAKDLAAIF